MRVLLVRHAMPDVDPAVPPRHWHLGPTGVAAAAALRLPPQALLVTSDEHKAAETVRHANGRRMSAGARRVLIDARFREVLRPARWHPEHRALARAYVEGAEHDGWEPRPQVIARFTAAITEYAARAHGRPLVVGTHGMAMTCWLAAHRLITGPPGEFWAALTFPQIVEVNLDRP